MLAIPEQPGALREEALFQYFAQGFVPDRLRNTFAIELKDQKGNTIVLSVLPDVLGVGTDDDWIRTPLAAPTAQRVADLVGGSLITRKLSLAIWASCDEIAPIPEAWWNVDGGKKMMRTSSYVEHNAAIQKAILGKNYPTLSGTKKDVVLTPQLGPNPTRVAIYGWHKLNGEPIQGLNAKTHELAYVDYSHGIRLVGADVIVNGSPAKLADVLADKDLCGLVSDEGPSTVSRYPTVYPGGSGGTKPPGGSPPAGGAPGGRPPTAPGAAALPSVSPQTKEEAAGLGLFVAAGMLAWKVLG